MVKVIGCISAAILYIEARKLFLIGLYAACNHVRIRI